MRRSIPRPQTAASSAGPCSGPLPASPRFALFVIPPAAISTIRERSRSRNTSRPTTRTSVRRGGAMRVAVTGPTHRNVREHAAFAHVVHSLDSPAKLRLDQLELAVPQRMKGMRHPEGSTCLRRFGCSRRPSRTDSSSASTARSSKSISGSRAGRLGTRRLRRCRKAGQKGGQDRSVDLTSARPGVR